MTGTEIAGAGTPEATWQDWPRLRRFPVLDLPTEPVRVVVVAPHPDDEVLGVGGLLAALAARPDPPVTVEIVAVSDGEASHPGSRTLRPAELRDRRVRERAEALRRLGVPTGPVHRLRLPDGGVAAAEGDLVRALAELLIPPPGSPPTWCLTTWAGDGHPDHEATGRATGRAAAGTGVQVLEYPVWTWHWARPDDARVPWQRARRVPLPPAAHRAKRSAVAAFTTQVTALSADPADGPVLPPAVLARLTRDEEVLFV